MSTTAEKTYTGSCHCGFIKYEVKLDLSDPKGSKCNCSICLKTNRLSLKAEPENFKLISPASLDEVPKYTFATHGQNHYYCQKCGIHCFLQGSYTYEGKTFTNMSINAVTLDPDQDVDFRKFKMEYWDGKTDNWQAGLAKEPYPGGTH